LALGELVDFLAGGFELGSALQVGGADLIGGSREGLQTVHGLAKVFPGLSQVCGQLSLAGDPGGCQESGEPDGN
jgi:hypothetical protein